MGKKKKACAEFRFYEKPGQEPVFALMGESWNRDYGEEDNGLHFHNMAEVGYCHHGSGEVILNQSHHNYEDGIFTFIPQNYPHTTNSIIRSEWSFFYFDSEEIVAEAFSGNIYKGEKIRTSISKDAFVFSIKEAPYLGNLVLMILELVRQGGDYSKDIIKCALVSLVLQILRLKEGVESSKGSEGRSKIVFALEYINYHYQEELMICDLADCCHLSETHFRRVFQTDMNMTPVEYINLIRVQAACDFMKKKDCYMDEVAINVGYQTMSTFNRNFKQIMGISPYQWKKQMDSELGRTERYRVSAKKGWEF